MAKLTFRYGAMNSGKSAALLMTAHNAEETGGRVLVMKPAVDTKAGGSVQSRMGVERAADVLLSPDGDPLAIVRASHRESPLSMVLVDEAQFLTPRQVDQLFEVAIGLDIPVIAYGLRTDFQTHTFPGAARLLAVAHNLLEERTMCGMGCGRKAVLNGREVDGHFVRQGEQIAIADQPNVHYVPLCGEHFTQYVGHLADFS